jgi:hypothetical protein
MWNHEDNSVSVQRSTFRCYHIQHIKLLFHNIAKECLCPLNANATIHKIVVKVFHPINVGYRWTAPY